MPRECCSIWLSKRKAPMLRRSFWHWLKCAKSHERQYKRIWMVLGLWALSFSLSPLRIFEDEGNATGLAGLLVGFRNDRGKNIAKQVFRIAFQAPLVCSTNLQSFIYPIALIFLIFKATFIQIRFDKKKSIKTEFLRLFGFYFMSFCQRSIFFPIRSIVKK